MTKLVLRGLKERRLRSVLMALAIVLGVAMISGTFVQTDAIRPRSTRSGSTRTRRCSRA
jgi:hypothetical protein